MFWYIRKTLDSQYLQYSHCQRCCPSRNILIINRLAYFFIAPLNFFFLYPRTSSILDNQINFVSTNTGPSPGNLLSILCFILSSHRKILPSLTFWNFSIQAGAACGVVNPVTSRPEPILKGDVDILLVTEMTSPKKGISIAGSIPSQLFNSSHWATIKLHHYTIC
jgi:hypothetical protein